MPSTKAQVSFLRLYVPSTKAHVSLPRLKMPSTKAHVSFPHLKMPSTKVHVSFAYSQTLLLISVSWIVRSHFKVINNLVKRNL